jgi:DNA gyrase subunit A
MQRITEEMLADIDKDTVDWAENYDGSRKEPTVLPARLPQLLLNGTVGIAVGMATNIPPHNLGELVDGIVHLIDEPECTVADLMKFIKGPDFPTGGMIYNKKDILEAYSTGRGGVTCRGKAEITEGHGGKPQIIITEIPYQVNKANLVIKIADLVKDKKIQGITDIRDESTRQGIRIVIELKRDSYPNKILNQLYKMTDLQTNFNFNMIALVDRGIQPHLLNIKQILEHFIEHRREVVVRRTEYELRIAKERAHILEGLKLALDHIDKVISTIRASKTREDAHAALMKLFKLSDVQARAILEMRLQALAGLERKKIEDELAEKYKLIKFLEDLLGSKAKILGVVKTELAEIKEKYADPRRTKVVATAIGEFSAKDTIPNEDMLIMLTTENYVKRVPPSAFRAQKRGGKGVIGLTAKEEDEVKLMRHAKNHDDIMFFTNTGRVFRLPAYEIPQATRTAKGTAIANLIQVQSNEYITAMRVVREGEDSGDTQSDSQYLFFCTRDGTVKKTPIADFANVRKSGLIAIGLNDGDELDWVKGTDGKNEIVIISHEGQCCRFHEDDVRPMGRSAAGVRGIKLADKDYVVEMDKVADPKTERLLVVTEKGQGKASHVSEYRLTARGASGVKTLNVTDKTGKVIGAKVLPPELTADLLLITKRGQTIRMEVGGIPTLGRNTQGVRLMKVTNDSVASISIMEHTPGALAIAESETGINLTGEGLLESEDADDEPTTPEEAAAAAEKSANAKELGDLLAAAKADGKAQKAEGKTKGEKAKADAKGAKELKSVKKPKGKQ